eukprot:110432_1
MLRNVRIILYGMQRLIKNSKSKSIRQLHINKGNKLLFVRLCSYDYHYKLRCLQKRFSSNVDRNSGSSCSSKYFITFLFGVALGGGIVWKLQPEIRKKERENKLAIAPINFEDLNIGMFHRTYLQSKYNIENAMKNKNVWDEFMEIDTQFVYYVCVGDGVLSDKELKALYKVQNIYGMSNKSITNTIDICKLNPLSASGVVDMYLSNSFNQTALGMGRDKIHHARCALLSSLEVAYADGLVKGEIDKAKQIGKMCGISEEEMDKLVEALYLETKLVNLYNELI